MKKTDIKKLLLLLPFSLLLTGCTKKTTYTDEIVVEIPGLEEEYDYFLLNDTHIFLENDEINPEYSDLVSQRIQSFSLDGKPSSKNFRECIENLDEKYLKGVILNADIQDQLSYANLSFIDKTMSTLSIPYMYLMSDHDLATDWTIPDEDDMKMISDLSEKMDIQKGFYTFEEDKFIILGMNYSWINISEETLTGIKEVFEKNKPVIIVTHVPYDSQVSDDLSDFSKEHKNNRVLLWGRYHDNIYYPDDNMCEFLNMVCSDDSKVVAVIAAHLHSSYEGKLTENIPEYIVGPAFCGVKTLIKVVPPKK